MANQQKITIVNQLVEKLQKAKAIVLTDPTGFTHKQLEDLRKKLKTTKSEYTITKNTLLSRAFAQLKKTLPVEVLTGTTATVFAYEDEASPLKTIVNFFKETTKGKVKIGLLGDTQLSIGDVERLAKLPAKNVLVSQLLAQLQAPITSLHYALNWNINKLVWVLNGVKNKKL